MKMALAFAAVSFVFGIVAANMGYPTVALVDHVLAAGAVLAAIIMAINSK